LNKNNKNQTKEQFQEKKKLYTDILNLPFCNYIDDFENLSTDILESEFINEDLKEYLEEKFSKKLKWVKAYMKESFSCGICTTSRIESKHRVYKRYLNSSIKLACLFQIFKDLEKEEITRFKEEISYKIGILENKKLDKSDLVKYFQPIYSDYVIRKLKNNLMESVNYSIEKKNQNLWYNLIYP